MNWIVKQSQNNFTHHFSIRQLNITFKTFSSNEHRQFILKHRASPLLAAGQFRVTARGRARAARRLVCKQIRACSGNHNRARFLGSGTTRLHTHELLRKKARIHLTLVHEICNKTFPSCNTAWDCYQRFAWLDCPIWKIWSDGKVQHGYYTK